jgi:hypothetical protein
MAMTRTGVLALLFPLAVAAFGGGCAHGRPTLEDVEDERERSIVLAEGVSVRATSWDRMLAVRAAEAAPDEPTHGAESRRARTDRLLARYSDRVVFTVLLELAHRSPSEDPLADPETWWFHLQRGGQTVAARDVDVLAIDRFPAASVRAGGRATVHLRIALLVAFDVPQMDDEPLIMRIGSHARAKRRYALGPLLARHGSTLRWTASTAR